MSFFRKLGGVALLLAAVGCATAPRQSGPAPQNLPLSDDLVEIYAVIVRAEDRRAVDATLLGALTDPRPAVRVRAALALGRIGSPEALDALEPLLDDPKPAVRKEAAFALGLSGRPDTVPLLAGMSVDSHAGVRANVAVALGMLGTAATAQPLEVLMVDQDPEVSSAAYLQVWRLPDPSFAVGILLRATESTDLRRRFAASYSLARLASAGLRPSGSDDTTARLSTLDRQKIRERMLALTTDPSPDVRMQVARALTVPSNATEEGALGVLLRDSDSRVRVSAVQAFSYPGAALDPYLSGALKDPNAQVVATAVAGLGRTQSPAAARTLLQGIARERRDWLRAIGIRALGEVDPSTAAATVARFLGANDPAMREAAVRSVVGHVDARVVELLQGLLLKDAARVQTAAVAVLGSESGSLRVLLGDAVAAPDPAVRAAVARVAGTRLSLAEAGSEQRQESLDVLDEIWERSADDDLTIARREALEAVARAGAAPEVRRFLMRGLDDPDRRVRARAVEQLERLFAEDHAGRLGPASDRTLTEYREIVEWLLAPKAAIVTVQRPGFAPGRFTVSLDTQEAPLTSWNFAQLAEAGFYDNVPVHRLVPNFVLQTGDRRGDGFGDPGYSIRSEINHVRFGAGTLGMASADDGSHGSQWFVTFSAQPHLDGRFTAFGRVVQNLAGVVLLVEPGDRIVSVEIYDGTGEEPLPPL